VAALEATLRVRVWVTGVELVTETEVGVRVIPEGAGVPSPLSKVRFTAPVNPF
jgi:hypothetical protein